MIEQITDGYYLIYYCQLYNKSLDADCINEIPTKLIKVLLYKHYMLIKVYDFITYYILYFIHGYISHIVTSRYKKDDIGY